MSASRAFSLERRLFNPDLYSRLVSLWFEGLHIKASAPQEEQMSRWFGLGASETARTTFDEQCQSSFQSALFSISPDKLPLPAFTNVDTDRKYYPDIASPFVGQFSREDCGPENHQAALRLILLLDQIPRNIFRNKQAIVYGHYDRISRAVFQEIYARGLDKHEQYIHSPPWRVWFYMPLMHSESIEDHQMLGREFEDLKSTAEEMKDKAAMEYMALTLGFEKKHHDLLLEFGRYPYRNKVLGRQTTAKELDWLKFGGDTFGA
jgi:uncharacterized protein (DUF924 family)